MTGVQTCALPIWNGTSRVGTTEWICEDPDRLQTPEEDKAYLLQSVNRYFPGEHLEGSDILSVDSGIRPLAKASGTFSLNAISREHEFRTGPTGVIHVLGVKLTDHRRAAEEFVNKLIRDPAFRSIPAKKESFSRIKPLD